MRQIIKSEPGFYTDFIRNEKPEHWDDIISIKQDLRKHMLENEQNWQCAYTELRIDETNSTSHIDHFKRKHSSLYPGLIFTYSNLFAASIDEDFGAKHKDKTVKTPGDYNNLLSPLTQDVSAQFEYNIDTGEIEGKNASANYTKDVFNLNHSKLLERRKTASEIALIYYSQEFTLDDTIQFIGEFESLIRYIYTVNNN